MVSCLMGAVSQPLVDVAAFASPLAFLCACVLVFFRPVFGYGPGLFAGLIALPWLVWTEAVLYDNSWISLNGAVGLVPGDKEFVAFVKLKILSGVLIVISVVCSSVRLLPSLMATEKIALVPAHMPSFWRRFSSASSRCTLFPQRLRCSEVPDDSYRPWPPFLFRQACSQRSLPCCQGQHLD